MQNELMVGLDVGSTTVKAVVVRRENDEMIWQDYQRHETKQPEKSLEFLRRIEEESGVDQKNCRVFVTGSGGGMIAELIGGKFVQEVTAVSLAVEKMHPRSTPWSSWAGRTPRSSSSKTTVTLDARRRSRP